MLCLGLFCQSIRPTGRSSSELARNPYFTVPHASVAAGSVFARLSDTVLNRLGEILFPVNPCAADKVTFLPWQLASANAVKSPCSSAAVGTYPVNAEGSDRCEVR